MIKFLKELISKYLKGSKYKKNVLIMIAGRVLAQALPILLTPLLTRIYSPGDFGVFGVFSTIISIVAMVSNGRYCLSIILPKDEEKARKLFFLSSSLSTISTILFTFFLLLFGNSFFGVLNTNVLAQYALIIVLNMLFLGLYESIYYYTLRVQAFKILTTNIIIQALVLIASRLILGYLGYTEIGLIFSYLLSYAVSYILLVIRLKMPVLRLVKEFNFGLYWKLIKEYYKFPKFSLLADTLSMTANMAPNILLNKVFGSVVTGYYSMSDKILASPLWLVTSSVGDVFKQEASEQFRTKGSCFKVFKKTATAMFFVGIVPFAVIFIVSPLIVPFLLGEGWEPVGDIIRIFSIMYFIKFVVRPIYPVLYIVRRQNYNAIFQAIHLLAIIVAFAVGISTMNLYVCLITWSVLTSISYIIIFIFSFKFAKETKYKVGEDT
ncbi:MAG: lipopolysaccharide biosynthesis protein [Candidatus Dojkabacteria bacterium]